MDPNLKNNQGNTVLHLAAAYNHANLIHYYLQKNTARLSLNLFNNEGYNPLHLAIVHDRLEATRALIPVINPNTTTQNNPRYSTLQLAVSCNVPTEKTTHFETAQLLLEEANVDPNYINDDGNDAFSIAILLEESQFAQLIFKHQLHTRIMNKTNSYESISRWALEEIAFAQENAPNIAKDLMEILNQLLPQKRQNSPISKYCPLFFTSAPPKKTGPDSKSDHYLNPTTP